MKMVALFVKDKNMKCGYRVETGCYFEETIRINGELCLKPRFLYYFDIRLDVDGRVFAWAELPNININDMRWFYGR